MIPRDWTDAISRAMRGDFGPPGKSLQQDIADELADHLAQSMDRERRAGKSEDEAKERVLNRFGSPSLIAARLWFDGMKGKIMFQRWMIGATILSFLAAFAVVGLALWTMRENQRTLVATIEKMDERWSVSQQMESEVTAYFRCVDELTSDPVVGVSLRLMSRPGSPKETNLAAISDERGVTTIGPLDKNIYYDLQIVLGDQWVHNGVVIFEHTGEMIIRCPELTSKKSSVDLKLSSSGVRGEVNGDNNIKGAVVKCTRFTRVDGRQFESPTPAIFVVTRQEPFKTADGRLIENDGNLDLYIGQYRMDILFIERPDGWQIGQETKMTGDKNLGSSSTEFKVKYHGSNSTEHLYIPFNSIEIPKSWEPERH